MVTVDDLAAFLAARYDEAETLAKAATPGPWHAGGGYVTAPESDAQVTDYGTQDEDQSDADSAFIADVDPAHRLADIKLKRAILAGHARVPVYTPETLAHYPDHPEMASMATCQRCHELNPDALIDDDRCGDLEWPCATVRQLGTEFTEHAAYQESWKP